MPLDLLAVDAEKNSPSSGESKTSAQPADRSGNAERRSETAAGGDNRGPDHGIYTWSIFGFTEGSDTDTPGGKTLYGQSDALLSKAIPGYWALEGNIGVSYSTDERMNVFAGASAGDEVILDNLRGSIVDSGSSTNAGVSGGIKYQFFDRANYGFGFAAQAAPYLTRTSPVLSPTIQAFGSEFRLLADTEFVPQVLFGAVNFAYTPEASSGSSGTTSSVEVSTALTGRVFDKFFLGAEARYLEKYQGLLFDQRLGWAMFAGPTLYISVADKGYFGIAWSVQMFGRPADQPSARLDLKNYERNQVRVKAGFYF